MNIEDAAKLQAQKVDVTFQVGILGASVEGEGIGRTLVVKAEVLGLGRDRPRLVSEVRIPEVVIADLRDGQFTDTIRHLIADGVRRDVLSGAFWDGAHNP